jgi:hypothetical protein
MIRGRAFAPRWNDDAPGITQQTTPANPFWDYATSCQRGTIIWKWTHYFDVYQRHLGCFIGRPVSLVEVGVLHGGSLNMWSHCLGEQARIYGVDIDPECKRYAHNNIVVAIGDQQDRQFWQAFKAQAPAVDILIDDGGHRPEQQIVTLEEMLPHLRPGGVYICEDIHRTGYAFTDYAAGLVHQLNQFDPTRHATGATSVAAPFQRAIYALHFYPFIMVIEKHCTMPADFTALQWGAEPSPHAWTQGRPSYDHECT